MTRKITGALVVAHHHRAHPRVKLHDDAPADRHARPGRVRAAPYPARLPASAEGPRVRSASAPADDPRPRQPEFRLQPRMASRALALLLLRIPRSSTVTPGERRHQRPHADPPAPHRSFIARPPPCRSAGAILMFRRVPPPPHKPHKLLPPPFGSRTVVPTRTRGLSSTTSPRRARFPSASSAPPRSASRSRSTLPPWPRACLAERPGHGPHRWCTALRAGTGHFRHARERRLLSYPPAIRCTPARPRDVSLNASRAFRQLSGVVLLESLKYLPPPTSATSCSRCRSSPVNAPIAAPKTSRRPLPRFRAIGSSRRTAHAALERPRRVHAVVTLPGRRDLRPKRVGAGSTTRARAHLPRPHRSRRPAPRRRRLASTR